MKPTIVESAPERCPSCGAGEDQLEPHLRIGRVRGRSIARQFLGLRCRACGHAWPDRPPPLQKKIAARESGDRETNRRKDYCTPESAPARGKKKPFPIIRGGQL